MSTITLDTSTTSDSSQTNGKVCTVGRFITAEEGAKIVAVAATWVGTTYVLVGKDSQKLVQGDCSGTTYWIYQEAGFPYKYQPTATFPDYVTKTNRFRKIDPATQPLQAGDVLFWQGHMAIYSPFPPGTPEHDTGQTIHGVKTPDDIYTAFKPGGRPYGPFNSKIIRTTPYTVYRYFILPTPENCNP